MRRGLARSRHDGRKAIAARLRALAAFAVLLLGVSSLGEVAHFLLVPHAICAEHGELVELHAGESASAHGDEAGAHQTRASAPSDATAEHDHCEILARTEREQALPLVPVFEVPAAARAAELVAAVVGAPVARTLSLLRLAPKTSPPAARA